MLIHSSKVHLLEPLNKGLGDLRAQLKAYHDTENGTTRRQIRENIVHHLAPAVTRSLKAAIEDCDKRLEILWKGSIEELEPIEKKLFADIYHHRQLLEIAEKSRDQSSSHTAEITTLRNQIRDMELERGRVLAQIDNIEYKMEGWHKNKKSKDDTGKEKEEYVVKLSQVEKKRFHRRVEVKRSIPGTSNTR